MAKITRNKNKVTVKFSVPEEAAIVFGNDGVEVICPPYDELSTIEGDEETRFVRQTKYIDSMKMSFENLEKIIGAVVGFSEVEVRQSSHLECLSARENNG